VGRHIYTLQISPDPVGIPRHPTLLIVIFSQVMHGLASGGAVAVGGKVADVQAFYSSC
jgi:hypothetical protein